MIRQVKVRYFKRFSEETLDTSGNIVLAGPNNSGKSTLLQAIAVWNLAFTKWQVERGSGSGSQAKKRTGVAITRKDFTAIPLREMKLLWTDCATSLYKDELENGQKLGTPRVLEISISATTNGENWELPFEFRYQSPEMVYAKPVIPDSEKWILEAAKKLTVVHVPPFSGIGAEETRFDRAYQDLLIGQGKPGEILRNLVLEIHSQRRNEWPNLCHDIEEIFAYKLLEPDYESRPFILCQYQPEASSLHGESSAPRLDISSAGSGFLQVLMLLGFFYARPATVLLLDEPDAHLHVILQSQVYNRLREVASRRQAQLLIATHSEVLIDNTAPELILSFYQRPHRLDQERERDQVREALKRLTSLDIVLAEQTPALLYTEAESDLDILREWARVLKHPALKFLDKQPSWRSIQGRDPRQARAHFFALKAVRPHVRGILLLDGDNRALPEHEISAEDLTIIRWKRYEIESYLIHPDTLTRYVESCYADLFTKPDPTAGLNYLKGELPPAVIANPLGDHEFFDRVPVSKALLPKYFDTCGVRLTKNEYYRLVAQMLPEEIPSEVTEKLDLIHKAAKGDPKA